MKKRKDEINLKFIKISIPWEEIPNYFYVAKYTVI